MRNNKDNKTEVDIVIPVHGRFDLLKRCLDAIPQAAQNTKYNVIIVDNASPEAKEFYDNLEQQPNLFIIRNKENTGFAKACNQGARRKQSPYIFLLNSDVFLYPYAIDVAVRTLQHEPNVGIVGMKLLFSQDTTNGPAGRVQHVGLWSDVHGRFNHAFMAWQPDNPKVQAVRQVLAVTGAALMIRRSLWNVVGGLNEGYGRGTYEDVELCLHVGSLGKEVIVEQLAVGEHFVGATAIAYNLGYPMQQNEMYFMSRWAGKYPWTQIMHV